MGIGSPGHFIGATMREEVEEARRHIKNALTRSGIGENEPLTELQYERLKDADKELSKALQTMRKKEFKHRQ